ncbi:hypothetical protein HBB16_18300 [Pseudonocardia sp. MCCB 268]|nr:hypothetical protein [Pseudonocardia cytotoxica]
MTSAPARSRLRRRRPAARDPPEIESVLQVLEKAGITAWSGRCYLAMLGPGPRDRAGALPHLAGGVLLNDLANAPRAREEPRRGPGRCRPAWSRWGPRYPDRRRRRRAPGIELVVPPNPALHDEDAERSGSGWSPRPRLAARTAALESTLTATGGCGPVRRLRDRRPTLDELTDAAVAGAARERDDAVRAHEASVAEVAALDERRRPAHCRPAGPRTDRCRGPAARRDSRRAARGTGPPHRPEERRRPVPTPPACGRRRRRRCRRRAGRAGGGTPSGPGTAAMPSPSPCGTRRPRRPEEEPDPAEAPGHPAAGAAGRLPAARDAYASAAVDTDPASGRWNVPRPTPPRNGSWSTACRARWRRRPPFCTPGRRRRRQPPRRRRAGQDRLHRGRAAPGRSRRPSWSSLRRELDRFPAGERPIDP